MLFASASSVSLCWLLSDLGVPIAFDYNRLLIKDCQALIATIA